MGRRMGARTEKESIVKHILSTLVLGLICGGCIALGDGGGNTRVTNPTVGKQLADLKDAHDKGIPSVTRNTPAQRPSSLADAHWIEPDNRSSAQPYTFGL